MSVRELDDVNVGDIIGADVRNSQGAVLVKTGVGVEERHLRLFKMWGVEKLEIRDGSDGGGAGELEALLDQAEAEIKQRFGPSLDNEIMAEILRMAVEQRAAKMTTRTK
jgi:hypothetical protein